VISQELSTSIFLDFHFPDAVKSSPELNSLAQILHWLSTVEPRRAGICRSQIAIICCQCGNIRQKIINQATQRVLTALNPWIFENREQLSNELAELFTEAVELWQPLQRADSHVMVKNDGDWIDEDTWPEYNDVNLLPANHQNNPQISINQPLAILFPRIYAGNDMISHGYALYPTQAAVIAAKLEHGQASPSIGLRRRNTGASNREPLNSRRTERRLSSTPYDTIQKTSLDGRREASHANAGSHRADRTASVSSTRSNKTGSVVGGQ
jgi:hypothetical protein